jgi:hypothetical protein
MFFVLLVGWEGVTVKLKFMLVVTESLFLVRTFLGPTQPPIHWVQGTLSLGVKRPEREANHSLPSSVEIKYA